MQTVTRLRQAIGISLLALLSFAITARGAEQWQYRSDRDSMRGTQTHYAELNSTTRLRDLGLQPVALTILVRRAEAEKADEVLLAMRNAQFTCGVRDCTATVKLGEQAPKKYALTRSSDMSTTVLFVERASEFLAQLMKSPKAIIEVDVFRGGRRQFEFDVPALALPDRPTKKK